MGVANRVLVLDDQDDFRTILQLTLETEGYEVRAEATGSSALAAAAAFRPDLAILDVLLGNGADGFSVGRELRARYDLPIIYLTALGDPDQRVAAFDAGADDIVIKGTPRPELLARVRAVLARTGRGAPTRWAVADLVVDEAAHTAHRGDRELDLTYLEFALLTVLIRERDHVVSKASLLAAVWGFDAYDANLVEAHISHLRRKLEAGGAPRLIQTVHNLGYVMRNGTSGAPAGESRPVGSRASSGDRRAALSSDRRRSDRRHQPDPPGDPMAATLVRTVASTLPPDDDHPYRSGAWRPNHREWDADDLEVEGDLPDDLAGVYLRNTENPVHPAIGKYHPFDGDGMVHQIAFADGRASYRNRFVRTDGFLAEQEAAESLWTGMLGHPEQSKREDGWGARGRMKDASSTDVVVHNGKALTSFWQCGDLYELDPRTLETTGKAAWTSGFPSPTGVSAHTKLDERTGELLVFGYGKDAPYMHYGVVSADGRLEHSIDIPLPGPRLPHDMAFTENYAILNDLPLFWDPDLLGQGIHLPRFYPDVPSRFAVVPRRGSTADIRWFEADPTYVLHWINAYEDGDEIVLDGFFQHDPSPPKRDTNASHLASVYRYLDLEQMQTRPHRWRFNLVTGETREESLSERFMEFGMINGTTAGQAYRYSYNMTGEPGWFLFDGLVKHDLHTGHEERYAFGEGVFGSETPFAPRSGATAEDDGYLVTFTTDMVRDCSECLVFDATDITIGPIARVRLPERISSGTHSCWTPASALPTV